MIPYWFLIERELDRALAVGRPVRFWWRDDDARDVSPLLIRLAELSARYQIPLVLAVVPSGDCLRLARFLSPYQWVFVAQHGVLHENRSNPGQPPSEFRPDDLVSYIAERISLGYSKIVQLPRALPLYVPPWNAVHPNLYPALTQLGIQMVSATGPLLIETNNLRQANVHLDLLRWRPTPYFRGRQRFLSRLWRLLRRRRLAGTWREPIGLLTHHLEQDDASWQFLKAFLARTHADQRIKWPEPHDLFF